MNILLTSVGRRSYLVDYFKEALEGRGDVFAANSDVMTSGMASADRSFVTPKINHPNYIPNLLDICKKNDITAVIPLFDIDLSYLAEARELFLSEGVSLIVSDPWVVEIANDKWKTYRFLIDNGFATPETYISLKSVKKALRGKSITFPLIVKPRWGMGSISLFIAESWKELEFFYDYAIKLVKKSYLSILSNQEIDNSIIIQQFIEGEEYGLDVFNNIAGNYVITVPKKKLSMRAGETDIAMAVKDESFCRIGERISSCLNHRGNMDVDILRDKSSRDFVIEINARFGGGYPFSHALGSNMVGFIVDELSGHESHIAPPVTGKVVMKSICTISAK